LSFSNVLDDRRACLRRPFDRCASGAAIDAFGLRNEKHVSGRFAGIPYPAAFIVKPDRTIAAKLFEADYTTNDKSYQNRPEVAAVLAAADASLWRLLLSFRRPIV
jgi:hypothetical protein